MMFAIGETFASDFIDGGFEANGGQHVVQSPTLPNVVVHIADRDYWQCHVPGNLVHRVEPSIAVLSQIMRIADIAPPETERTKPERVFGRYARTRYPQSDGVPNRGIEIAATQGVAVRAALD